MSDPAPADVTEPTVQPAPTNQPTFNEDAYQSGPTVDTKSLYDNEFGRLIAPKDTLDTYAENLRIMRHFSVFNTPIIHDDLEDGMSGGLAVRAAARWGLESKLNAEGKQKLSLEETKKIYPQATEPLHQEIAMSLAEQKRVVDGARAYAARGGDLNWAENLGLGLYKMATEPMDLATMFLSGGLSASAMGAIGVRESVGSIFLSNVLQNVAMNEAAAPMARKEGEDITQKGVFLDSLVGGGFGTAIHFGAKFLLGRGGAPGDEVPGPRPTPPTPPDVENSRFWTGIVQDEMGQKIDPRNLGEKIVQIRRDGNPPAANALNHYVWRPLDPVNPAENRAWFVSGSERHTNALTGLGGEGSIELSDNANHQNMWGDVAEVKTSKLNLLNLDQKASALPGVMDLINRSVKDQMVSLGGHEVTDVNSRVSFPIDSSLREVLDHVQAQYPEALRAIKEGLKTEGYDGYSYTHVGADGNPTHNGLVLFDGTKTEVVGGYRQNSDLVPRVTPEDVQKFLDNPNRAETSPYYEPGVSEEHPQKLLEGPSYTEPPEQFDDKIGNEVRAQAAQAEKAVKQMMEAEPDKYGGLAEELKAIDEEFKQDQQKAKLLRMLGDCVGKGL